MDRLFRIGQPPLRVSRWYCDKSKLVRELQLISLHLEIARIQDLRHWRFLILLILSGKPDYSEIEAHTMTHMHKSSVHHFSITILPALWFKDMSQSRVRNLLIKD
jgi:hypothetical protein